MSIPSIRASIAILTLALGGIAAADTNITIPTAILVPNNFADITGYYNGGGNYWRQGGIRAAFGNGFEAAFATSRSLNGTGRQTYDFEYQYLAPFSSSNPGIAFGLLDASNVTPTGRRVYAVFTQRVEMNADLSHDLMANVSLGFQVGRTTSPFVGVKIPLGSQFFLMGEHDGINVNSGVEFDPSPSVALSLYSRGRETVMKVRYRVRF